MSLFYQQMSGRHLWASFNPFLKKLFATCITMVRIAITTATIQFMHLVLAGGIVNSFTPIS